MTGNGTKWAPPAQRFAQVVSSARLHLCAVSRDNAEVRVQHVAAVLAWNTDVRRVGDRLLYRFEHGPTAMWVSELLPASDVELIDVGGDGGTVAIGNPQRVLAPYGYRQGSWIFRQGMVAALGISRGAVHAAGVFNGQGMKVVCPSPPMMLMLTAVLQRLGVEARPMGGGVPRVLISGAAVSDALDKLGIAAVAGDYRRIRGSAS